MTTEASQAMDAVTVAIDRMGEYQSSIAAAIEESIERISSSLSDLVRQVA